MSPASMSRHSSLTSSSIGSSSLHSASGSGQGTPVKTMKHFEDSLKCVKKENFNLKLKIFFLEEKLSTGDETSDLSLIQANTDLKIQVENMKQDLNDKLDLLLEARDAIEKLEEKVEEQKKQHIKEIFAVENKVNLANLNNNKNCNSCNKRKKLKPSNLSERAVFSATDRP